MFDDFDWFAAFWGFLVGAVGCLFFLIFIAAVTGEGSSSIPVAAWSVVARTAVQGGDGTAYIITYRDPKGACYTVWADADAVTVLPTSACP